MTGKIQFSGISKGQILYVFTHSRYAHEIFGCVGQIASIHGTHFTRGPYVVHPCLWQSAFYNINFRLVNKSYCFSLWYIIRYNYKFTFHMELKISVPTSPCVEIYDGFSSSSDLGLSHQMNTNFKSFVDAQQICQMYGSSLVMGRNRVEYDIMMYYISQYSSKLFQFCTLESANN